MKKASMFFLLVALCALPAMTSYAANLVLNGSFEDTVPTEPFPYYGPVDYWNGASGVNTNSGPFWDNGSHVNGTQVAFKQGSGVMSQDVDGFVSGQKYTLRFAENMRNCCNIPSVDLVVRLNGSDLVPQHTIVVGEFVAMTATFDSPGDGIFTLEFEVIVTVGDGTFVVDAVSIVPEGEADPFPLNLRPLGIVANGSFELSEPAGVWPWLGVAIWWTSTTAACGVNDNTGPFWDNGTSMDGTQVGFLQGAGTLSQTLVGLVSGQEYTLWFRENARTGVALPNVTVLINDVVVLADHQVASGDFVVRSVDFTSPGAGDFDLDFVCTAPQGDSTFLVDAVAVVNKGEGDPYATYCWPINVFKTTTPPTIDGVVNVASEYANAQAVDLRLGTLNTVDPYSPDCTHAGTHFIAGGSVENDDDNSALMYYLWDDQALYMAVVGKDEQMNPVGNPCGEYACGSAGVNQGDTFQLCLDYNQNEATDGQVVGTNVYIPSWALFENANNVEWFQQFWPVENPNPFTGITYNMKTNATGYVLEARIPWTAFTAGGDTYTKPFPPVNGQTCGVLPMLEDNDDATVSFLYTSGKGTNIIVNASAYNDLVFRTETGWPIKISKVSQPPVIDGNINVGAGAEWPTGTGQLEVMDMRLSTLTVPDPYNPGFVHNGGQVNGTFDNDADGSALYYYAWDNAGFYMAADITDQTLAPNVVARGSNGGDAFQVCLDYDLTKVTNGNTSGKVFIPTIAAAANVGTAPADGNSPNFAAFWPEANPNPMTGTQWGVTTSSTGYKVEVSVPWSAFTAGGVTFTNPFPPVAGQKMGILVMIDDHEPTPGAGVTFMFPAGGGTGIWASADQYPEATFDGNIITDVADWSQY